MHCMLNTIKVYACPAVQIYNNNNPFKFSQGDVRPVCRSPIQLGVGGVFSTQTFRTLLHNETYAGRGLVLDKIDCENFVQ